MTEDKKNLKVVVEAVNSVLVPLGFKKNQLTWRRQTQEVQQQFSLVSMRLGGRLRPEWGLNLCSTWDGHPRPAHRMDVRWIFEMTGFDIKRQHAVFEALTLHSQLTNSLRAESLRSFLELIVVPAFEMFQTEMSVKTMTGNSKHKFRAATFRGCPKEWKATPSKAKAVKITNDGPDARIVWYEIKEPKSLGDR